MFDAELESFKNGIDLRAYAAEQGYRLDRKESWRGSAVMRHPNGDKICHQARLRWSLRLFFGAPGQR